MSSRNPFTDTAPLSEAELERRRREVLGRAGAPREPAEAPLVADQPASLPREPRLAGWGLAGTRRQG